MRMFGIAEPFDSGDLFACDARGRLGATFLGCAVDQNHAAATLFKPAAKARSDETEVVAQDVEEWRILVVERNADVFAVNREFDGLWHAYFLESELLAQNAFVQIMAGI